MNSLKIYTYLLQKCSLEKHAGCYIKISSLLLVIYNVQYLHTHYFSLQADNFEMNAIAIHRQLDNLKALLQYVYPRLYHHFGRTFREIFTRKNETLIFQMISSEIHFLRQKRIWEFVLLLSMALDPLQKRVCFRRHHETVGGTK